MAIGPNDSEFGARAVSGRAWVHLNEDEFAFARTEFEQLANKLRHVVSLKSRKLMMSLADCWQGESCEAAIREAGSIVSDHEINGDLAATVARKLGEIEDAIVRLKMRVNNVAADLQRACEGILGEPIAKGRPDTRWERVGHLVKRAYIENSIAVARAAEELADHLGVSILDRGGAGELPINSDVNSDSQDEAITFTDSLLPLHSPNSKRSFEDHGPLLGGDFSPPFPFGVDAGWNRDRGPFLEEAGDDGSSLPNPSSGSDLSGAITIDGASLRAGTAPVLGMSGLVVRQVPVDGRAPGAPLGSWDNLNANYLQATDVAGRGSEAAASAIEGTARNTNPLPAPTISLTGTVSPPGEDLLGAGHDVSPAITTGTPFAIGPSASPVSMVSPAGPGVSTTPVPPAVPLGPPSAPPPAASGPMNASPGLTVAPATASGGSHSAAGPAPAPVPITAARAERDAIALAATANALRRKNGGKDPIRLARQIAAALNAPPSIPDMAWAFMWATGVTTDNRIVVANTYGLAYIPDGVNLPDQVCMVTADEVIPPGERARWVAHPFLALQGWGEFHDTRLKAVIGTAEQLTGIDPGVAKVIIDPADIPQDGTMRGRCRLEVIASQAAAQLRATADQALGELLPPAPVDNVAAADLGQQLWFEMLKPLMRSGADRESAHLEAFVGYAEHQQQSALHRAHAVADVSALRAEIADWVYWQHVSVLAADGLAQLR